MGRIVLRGVSALVVVFFGGCGPSTNETTGEGGATTSQTTSVGGGGSTSTGQGATTLVGGGGGAGGNGGNGGTIENGRPEKPAGLVSYVTGNDTDKDVVPMGPGVILMGGGTDVDAAFQWWKPMLAGGDVVVLRTSGADGYNSYLFGDIGGCDSVETLLVTTKTLASDPYVVWTIEHAEGVFMAGGDQATYLNAWKDTPLEDALMKTYNRGAVLGGTSAGCAVLGENMFAAYNDTVYSDEALGDPYNQYMTMEKEFLTIPLLKGWITDTHFVTRDRMGRLVTFLARIVEDGWSKTQWGIGIDEETAIVSGPDGVGQVLGNGAAYLVKTAGKPTQCSKGKALEYSDLPYVKLVPGDMVKLPSGETVNASSMLSASGGLLIPADPY